MGTRTSQLFLAGVLSECFNISCSLSRIPTVTGNLRLAILGPSVAFDKLAGEFTLGMFAAPPLVTLVVSLLGVVP